MSFGLSAAAIGGIAAGVGAVGGAAISAGASKKAAKAGADASAQAAAYQQAQYDQTRQDQTPFRQAGVSAINQLQALLGLSSGGPLPQTAENFDADAYLAANPDVAKSSWDPWTHYNQMGRNEGRQYYYTPQAQDQMQRAQAAQQSAQGNGQFGSLMRNFTADDFETDPGYQFRLGEGQKQIESSAAARGGLLSGAAAKALTKYNQNFASNEYQNAFNRFNTNQGNTFNRLASLAGVGQTATNQLQQAGQNFANNAGQAAIYGGTARASGYAGQANALSSGLGGVASAFNNIPFGGGSTYSNPYGTYSAQTSPVVDYYSGTQPTEYLA